MITNGTSITLEVIQEVGHEVITSPVFWFLLASMTLEMFTGICKAFITGTYSSRIGLDGIVKHSMVLLFSIFVAFFFRVFGIAPIGMIIKGILALNYIISIIENMQVSGLNIPDSIKQYFLQMQDNAEEELIRVKDVNVVITNNTKDKKGEDR